MDLGYNLLLDYYGREQAISKFNFHTTIMYSENESSLGNIRKKLFPISARAIDLKYLGSMNNIPALIVNSPKISRLNWKYRIMGLVSSYPIFMPHISVSYDPNSPVYTQKVLPDFDLVYDMLVIEDLTD